MQAKNEPGHKNLFLRSQKRNQDTFDYTIQRYCHEQFRFTGPKWYCPIFSFCFKEFVVSNSQYSARTSQQRKLVLAVRKRAVLLIDTHHRYFDPKSHSIGKLLPALPELALGD